MKITFASGVKAPSHLDVLRFAANVLKIPAADVHSIYKDENDRCFYVKFADEPDFDCFVSGMEEQYPFEYSDGGNTVVRLEVASRLFRYVRIFNLPPETDDKEIAVALGQFGLIRQHVRERYPASYGYSVYSGIRGVHMEISKEIPATLYIGHFKARLYYEGLKNRCFFCKMEGHLKADCPKIAAKNSSTTASYSGIVAGAIANNSTNSNNSVEQPNMTTLPLPNNRSASKTNEQPSTSKHSANVIEVDEDKEGGDQDQGMERTAQSSSENNEPTDELSPRRGRSRTKKPNVEQRMESLLSQLSGRSRSRSQVKKTGKEKRSQT